MIRIVGTFAAAGGGSTVDYRIEFIPAALIALAISIPISLAVLAVLWWRANLPIATLAWLIAITVLVGAANLWFSERHARWLKRFIQHELASRS